MEELKQRVRTDGRDLGRGIIKVDGFINHRIDAGLMQRSGAELARRFASTKPDLVLTAEISGIAPALAAAVALDVPCVYARKTKPITMSEPVFVESAPSHTKGVEVLLMVSPEYLHEGERVLIIDDFLATGHTIAALARLVKAAKATLVGIGALVEKRFEGGRASLEGLGVPIETLVNITAMDGQIHVE
jgi:xanthine phosphoribosyltransferase